MTRLLRSFVTLGALAGSLAALAAPGRAQTAAPSDTTTPAAKPEDVASMDAIMHAIYASISGPAGPRDWPRFYSLFAPGARLIPTAHPKDGSAPHVNAMTPQQYVARVSPAFDKMPFYETEIGRTAETFGSVTQVFSAYASRHAPGDATPFARGINSFQLFNDGTRWYVVTIYWEAERPGLEIPARYLTPSR